MAKNTSILLKNKPKICLMTASLGGFDRTVTPIDQSLPFTYFSYNDNNFPPRFNSMLPRLQAKIPKCFSWQIAPNYDYYLWLDGNITLRDSTALEYFLNLCQGHDIVVFKHYRRPDIRQEYRYTRKGVKQQRLYLSARYKNEQYKELYEEILQDKDYVDDSLFMGGIFFYKNSPQVQAMFRHWWYFISRYCTQDQLSFTYVLKNSGLKIKTILDVYGDLPYFSATGHNSRK